MIYVQIIQSAHNNLTEKENEMKRNLKTLIASTLIIGASLFSATPSFAQNPSGKALTWQGYPLPTADQNVVRVGCYNNCDAYNGDTSINEKRRILCIIPGKSEPSAEYVNYATSQRPNDWQFYMGWSGAQVALSAPILGIDVSSKAIANKICQKTMRSESARIAEFHDNKSGGWSFGATIHQNSQAKASLRGKTKERFWVEINDQNANPW